MDLDNEDSVPADVQCRRRQEGRSSQVSSPAQTKRSDRSVLSIDDALSEENYDQMELPSESYATYKASLGPAKKKGVEKIEWKSKPPANQGRQRACDVVRGTLGLRTNAAKAVESIRNAFQLFIPNNMIQIIVQSTDRKIEEVLDDLPEEAVNDSTRPYLRTTTVLGMNKSLIQALTAV